MLVSESYVRNITYDDNREAFTGDISLTIAPDGSNVDNRQVLMRVTIQRPYDSQISRIHTELLREAFELLEKETKAS